MSARVERRERSERRTTLRREDDRRPSPKGVAFAGERAREPESQSRPVFVLASNGYNWE